jgi:hypothetical protein
MAVPFIFGSKRVDVNLQTKKAALGAAFFEYVSDYASAMMITLIEVITSE